MNTRLRATLEAAMEKWLNKHCGDDDWPDIWCHHTLASDMATAAVSVFDATLAGQRFYRDEVEQG